MKRAAWLYEAAQRLQKAGVEDASAEARLLLCAALGIDGAQLLAGYDDALDEAQQKRVSQWLERREKREPLARIRGSREFWKSSFILNEATLEPRADTETIVETALEFFPDRPRSLRLLDLGTGTGCILLSLLQELPNATGLGTDKSAQALEAAIENARALGLSARAAFKNTSWAEGVDEKFDLVVSNPPYIVSKDIPGLQAEVWLFDPALALDGGNDGLQAYRDIAACLPRLLNENGRAVVEIGQGQENDVSVLFMEKGIKTLWQRRDLAGIVRALGLQRG